MSSMNPAHGSGEPKPQPYRIGQVLYEDDQRVADFVRLKIKGLEKTAGWSLFKALGVERDGQLIGGVVFHDFRAAAGDVEITAAFTDPGWCTRQTLKRIVAYPVVTWQCRRSTARTAESNGRARRFLEGLGFKLEGRLRRGYDGVEDMLIYGVLKDEGRWPTLERGMD